MVGGAEARAAGAVLPGERAPRREMAEHPVDRDGAATRIEAGPRHDVLHAAPGSDRGIQFRFHEHPCGEPVDVLVEQQMGVREARAEDGHQARRQAAGDRRRHALGLLSQ